MAANDTTERDRQIWRIIEQFDWEKVRRTMEFLNWRWQTRANGMAIPGVKELQETAVTLLRGAWDCDFSEDAGGFCASCSEKKLYLRFILEEY